LRPCHLGPIWWISFSRNLQIKNSNWFKFRFFGTTLYDLLLPSNWKLLCLIIIFL
jgi:hypothetical protein